MYCVVARMRRLISVSISNSSLPARHSAIEPWHVAAPFAAGSQFSWLKSPPAETEAVKRAATKMEDMRKRPLELAIVGVVALFLSLSLSLCMKNYWDSSRQNSGLASCFKEDKIGVWNMTLLLYIITEMPICLTTVFESFAFL